jgi:hypothetical protein
MTTMKGEPQSSIEIDDGRAPWQFSLRSLLVVVTFVSVLLAIGVHLGGILVALIAVGILQAGILLSADWLIRPAHRRALAFVTAASWAIVGSSFVIGAIVTSNEIVSNNTGSLLSWSFTISLFGAGALSYYVAMRRWQQLSVRRFE